MTFVEASGTEPPPSLLRLFEALMDQGLSPRFLQGTAQRDVWLLMVEEDLDALADPIRSCLNTLDEGVRRWTFRDANPGGLPS